MLSLIIKILLIIILAPIAYVIAKIISIIFSSKEKRLYKIFKIFSKIMKKCYRNNDTSVWRDINTASVKKFNKNLDELQKAYPQYNYRALKVKL